MSSSRVLESITTSPFAIHPLSSGQRPETAREHIARSLPELAQLERLLAKAPDGVNSRIEASVALSDELHLPIYSISLGTRDPHAPLLLLSAGLHGIERIGSEVLLGFLAGLFERMQWDQAITTLLEKLHIVVLPIVNPGGMLLRTRANPNGIDLNRNAPIDVEPGQHKRIFWPTGGQRLGAFLPWYRGRKSSPMELENRVLQAVVRRAVSGRPVAISLDIHSGFGCRDRIWIPYAYRRRPIACLPEMKALADLWAGSNPHHNYQFEPQSNHYLAHGDVWDYLHNQLEQELLFLPLTLELGSWNWLRKRPRQLFNRLGLFHPLVPHRLKRAVRDHQSLLQFLMSAVASCEAWLPATDDRESLREAAIELWYQE
ncbi:DUF2817 domain-containing protein [Halioxenophilus sp. WMMB6]|uniref:DUF2817 domain-containing protein n=1 Tax=Halioxenophilus sp. WMMB6 TaxID=3073815 RepID=UPI00295E626C|nr:DUF2817 domain-containing protein [Halioxenophilus sp. WMMB6]